MRDYEPPSAEDLDVMGVEAHFLGQYLPWDSHQNAQIAIDAGMEAKRPSVANWWPFENLDNAQTGIHDHMMWRKYGFGRAAAQLSVDIRDGRISRPDAAAICLQTDGLFPETYAGVTLTEILDRIEMTRPRLNEIMDQFTNKAIHQQDGTPWASLPA